MLGETLRQPDYCRNNDQQLDILPTCEYENNPVPDGPNINVVTRAFYLLESIDEFSKAAKNNGHHSITDQNEPGDRRKIKNISKSAKEHEHRGMIAFLNANNLDPYAKNSIQTEMLIARTVVLAEYFKQDYIGPVNKSKRDLLKKRLNKQIEVLSPLE